MFESQRTALCIVMCLLSAVASIAAELSTVNSVEALCVDGKTYVTFKKGTQPETGYLVYRFEQNPTDIGSTKPIAKLPANSHLHPDANLALVIPPGHTLTGDDGLFVNTPKHPAAAWYAVLPDGKSGPLIAGTNMTRVAVNEAPAEKPSAVLQIQKTKYQQVEDHYASWMDYETWQADPTPGSWRNSDPEYYGSFFSISYLKGANEGEKLPVLVSLHALNGGGNGEPAALTAQKGMYCIFVEDHRRRWWEGKTAARINAQIDFLITCDKYKIDRDRVYIDGTSMGGHGALLHALSFPEKYAGIYSRVAKIDETLMNLVKRDPEFPPIVTFFGFRDPYGPKQHAPFVKKMQEDVQGVWTRWADVPHAFPDSFKPFDTCIKGGLLRFKRNEPHPVFMNTSSDDNCGQTGETNVVAAGQLNQTIDWSSSLHPLPLQDNTLIDRPDELSVAFQATPDCRTNLAFRRIQAFHPKAGQKIAFRNVSASDGSVLQEGSLIIPADAIWILKDIQMTTAGNRVSVRIER